MERLTDSGTKEAKPDATIREIINKLAEYEDFEEQGKLLKLPASIGDEIFFIFMDCPKDYKEQYCRDHEGSCENCHHRVPEIVSRYFRVSDIPSMDKIFATREEAEAALKELTEGNNEQEKIWILINYIINNMHWCPFKDETDMGLEKECVGFGEAGCGKCILRHLDKLK